VHVKKKKKLVHKAVHGENQNEDSTKAVVGEQKRFHSSIRKSIKHSKDGRSVFW
jgi:hypothetical protein